MAEYKPKKYPFTVEFPVTVVDHGDAVDRVTTAIEQLIKEQSSG